MTERRSWRALARDIYADGLEQEALKRTPLPNPPPQGGREQSLHVAPVAETKQTALTAWVRRLYEESALPIREIARLAGVTERTIYKYAARDQWAPRYLWNTEGTRPPGRPRRRGTGWQARGALAPAQGAGGRFIARDDRGKPVATGLKATDPDAAARADAACAAAALREHDAYVSAVMLRHGEERDRVWRRINKALEAVERYRARDAQESMRSRFGRMGDPAQRAQYVRERLAASAKNGAEHDWRERPLWAEVRAAREALHALRDAQARTMADLAAQRPMPAS